MHKFNYIKVPLIMTGLYFVSPISSAQASEVEETPTPNVTATTQEVTQEQQVAGDDNVTDHSLTTQPLNAPAEQNNSSEVQGNTYSATETFDEDLEDVASDMDVDEASDEPFVYDTSKDPNYDAEGNLIDTRKKLTGSDMKAETAFVHTDNANYTGEIESLKGGDGSGAVIGKNLILTAGHVLYNNNYPRDYMTGGYVIPGKDGENEPYGRFKIKAMYVPDKYQETPWRRYDMGIIEVEPNEKGQSIGDLIQPYNIKPFDRSMIGKKVYSQGYPIEKNRLTKNQWQADGTIIQVQEQGTIEYSMLNSEGQSGGPVLLDNSRDIVAIHTYGTRGNDYGTLGTPITPELYDWINGFIEKEAPRMPVEDVASIEQGDAPAKEDVASVEQGDVPAKEDVASVEEPAEPVQVKEEQQSSDDVTQNTPASMHTTEKESEQPVTVPVSASGSSDVGVKSITNAMAKVEKTTVTPVTYHPNHSDDDSTVRTQTTHKAHLTDMRPGKSSGTSSTNNVTKRQLPYTGESETHTAPVMGFVLAFLGAIAIRFRKQFKNMK
ncbi:hypothetical protein TP70_05260 [Staphylococcus microti]|uniref:Serine protease n=1 Tax=Staphylococcus microti TaxID=569857 RepID=A0A0D6XQP2_9STAP|nr:trypsin-like serine protease [Staphylococcus microti]KIX90887.1 hypothetical protein TP70_05260 [Staphylococcus microti]SUM58543.1 putative glutamyl-endopeptidase [Staphylococcus microti]